MVPKANKLHCTWTFKMHTRGCMYTRCLSVSFNNQDMLTLLSSVPKSLWITKILRCMKSSRLIALQHSPSFTILSRVRRPPSQHLVPAPLHYTSSLNSSQEQTQANLFRVVWLTLNSNLANPEKNIKSLSF